MGKKIMKASLVVFLLLLSCKNAPKSQVKEDTGAKMIDITSENQQLAKQSIGGFAYKSSKLNLDRWDRWAVKGAPLVRDIVGLLPEGYVLQVTGHADASGPEEPVGNKPGNIKLSTDRANTVYDALKRAGIDSPNIVIKGVGSSELLKDYDPRGAEQRRVDFRIVAR